MDVYHSSAVPFEGFLEHCDDHHKSSTDTLLFLQIEIEIDMWRVSKLSSTCRNLLLSICCVLINYCISIMINQGTGFTYMSFPVSLWEYKAVGEGNRINESINKNNLVFLLCISHGADLKTIWLHWNSDISHPNSLSGMMILLNIILQGHKYSKCEIFCKPSHQIMLL